MSSKTNLSTELAMEVLGGVDYVRLPIRVLFDLASWLEYNGEDAEFRQVMKIIDQKLAEQGE